MMNGRSPTLASIPVSEGFRRILDRDWSFARGYEAVIGQVGRSCDPSFRTSGYLKRLRLDSGKGNADSGSLQAQWREGPLAASTQSVFARRDKQSSTLAAASLSLRTSSWRGGQNSAHHVSLEPHGQASSSRGGADADREAPKKDGDLTPVCPDYSNDWRSKLGDAHGATAFMSACNSAFCSAQAAERLKDEATRRPDAGLVAVRDYMRTWATTNGLCEGAVDFLTHLLQDLSLLSPAEAATRLAAVRFLSIGNTAVPRNGNGRPVCMDGDTVNPSSTLHRRQLMRAVDAGHLSAADAANGAHLNNSFVVYVKTKYVKKTGTSKRTYDKFNMKTDWQKNCVQARPTPAPFPLPVPCLLAPARLLLHATHLPLPPPLPFPKELNIMAVHMLNASGANITFVLSRNASSDVALGVGQESMLGTLRPLLVPAWRNFPELTVAYGSAGHPEQLLRMWGGKTSDLGPKTARSSQQAGPSA